MYKMKHDIKNDVAQTKLFFRFVYQVHYAVIKATFGPRALMTKSKDIWNLKLSHKLIKDVHSSTSVSKQRMFLKATYVPVSNHETFIDC